MHQRVTYLIAFVVVLGTASFALETVHAQSDSFLDGLVCSTDYDSDYGEEPGGDYCRGGGLPGATVTLASAEAGLLGPADQTTTTGERGTFHFDGLDDGEYTLSVERSGFEPYETAIEIQGKAYREISLSGLSVSQSGTVTDADGAPVADAQISISGNQYHQTSSASDGTFAVEITAGHHHLRISHSEKRTLSQYILLDGESQTFSLQDAPERTAALFGKITDQDGNPVAGAVLYANQYHCCYAYAADGESTTSSEPRPIAAPAEEPYYEDGYQETRSGDDGSYQLDLYDGYVYLSAQKEGHAGHWADFELQDGEEREHDFVMQKYPPKTARIEGRAFDSTTGDGVGSLYVSVESPQYGIYECSVQGAHGSEDGASSSDEAMWYPRDCSITVHSDGTFEGMVTPGYTIIHVNHDYWSACSETRHADGSSERTCGPQYMAYTRTLTLAADDTTQIDVPLKQRPAPDAVISGYVVDEEAQTAIPGAWISFRNQDSHSWGEAQTDKDGSYKVRVRSGYHHVNVWADGFLRWQGVVEVPRSGDIAFDIPLTAGQDQYGGCCYAYGHGAEEAAVASDGGSDASGVAAAPSEPNRASSDQDGDASADFQNEGGGLGAYDAAKRSSFQGQPGEVKDSPGAFLVPLLLLGALAMLRRRR